MNAIEVAGLSRTFKNLRAVDNISFTVEAGEIFGFLGHNGAGKTTSIRMLTGQLRPTAGQAQVAGCDVVTERQRLKPLIGVVSENQNLYERMSGRENLAFAARLYSTTSKRVDEALDQVGFMNPHYSCTPKRRTGAISSAREDVTFPHGAGASDDG